MRKPKNKRKWLMEKIWETMSLYIRLKNSEKEYCTCVTCGSKHHYKEIHAGHFVPAGSSLKWRFVEENVHPQCCYCNTYLHGNLAKYTLVMIDLYGKEAVEEMLTDTKGLKPYKVGIGELEELLEHYKQRLDKIKTKC